MGRGRSTSSSSSSSLYPQNNRSDLSTDLRLGLSISSASHQKRPKTVSASEEENEYECNSSTFFVKVYMEGIPIGRKLDLLAHDGYHDLIRTLDYMFNTTIIWSEMDCEHAEQCHVLTYEDKEGDWLMVGDVPWEMFLSSVRRLKITRVDNY